MIKSQKVALVSGSTRGIGKAIAKQLILDGYKVVQNSRSSVEPSQIIGHSHIKADVTKEKECKELIEKILQSYGSLNLLVCNVGSGASLGNEASPSDIWSHFLSVNLNSTTYLVESALASLIAATGSVVAISSICAEDPTIDAPIGYATAKAGLEMFMKMMAVRYAKNGVRFNVVSPGNVIFENSVWAHKMKADNLAVTSYLEQQVPLGKFIEPQEIGSAVSFLASSHARNITGAVLQVDGGQSL